jgi:hypothetical protein
MLAIFPPAPATTSRLEHYAASSPGRADVERFIAAIFRERFGADLRHFAPVLVARRDAAGTLVAAAGYRPADTGALFLERYLDTPVHRTLGAVRAHIVEVGHLAASRAGEGRKLILQMGPHLAALNFHWVVGTLTVELRHLFMRLGLAPRALGVADPSVLGDDATHWGAYYDHHPVVLAGAIGPALQALARRGVTA